MVILRLVRKPSGVEGERVGLQPTPTGLHRCMVGMCSSLGIVPLVTTVGH
jgi:hypothetical protein